MLENMTRKIFDENKLSSKPFVIYAGAGWCKPCHNLRPTIEKLATEFADKFIIYYLDCDTELGASVAGDLRVMAIPVLIFMKEKDVNRLVGVSSEKDIRKSIDEFLK